MNQKVLFIGTNWQAREFKKSKGIPGLITLAENADVEYCTLRDSLESAVSGSDTPEDRETWKLPDMVFYTGQIREFVPEDRVGPNATLNVPKIIENVLDRYGIITRAKVNMYCP